MRGKIALEEHFAFEGTIGGAEFLHGKSEFWPTLKRQLVDLHDERIAKMDRLGIEFSILSLNAPAIQAMTNGREAAELARRANDYLAEQVASRPDRFAGFATLPMQDPEAATRELTRCVKHLGFKGALINGFSHNEGVEQSAVYYDEPQYWPFWAELERLDVPFYLHPRDPVTSQQLIYNGHPWLLTAAWAFGVETATHALRLMCSGLFDQHPKLRVLIGHLGEGLTFSMWRVDHATRRDPRGIKAQKKPSEYFRKHFYVTTSGNFYTPSLISAMLEIGSDHVMFATDYPYERMEQASDWFDSAPISDNDREKIGRLNAIKLFNLSLGETKSAGAGSK